MPSGSGIEKPARRHVGGEAGLREDRDIRGGAGFGVDHDLLLEAVGAGVDHFGAGRVGEIGQTSRKTSSSGCSQGPAIVTV